MKIKMVDIARHLGVSKATVSLAVNGKPGVNEETRKKVLDCLELMKQNDGKIPEEKPENDEAVSGEYLTDRNGTVSEWQNASKQSEQSVRGRSGNSSFATMTAEPEKQINGQLTNRMIKVVIVNHRRQVVCDPELDLWSEVLSTFDAEARKRGYLYGLSYLNEAEEEKESVIAECNLDLVAGVIFFGTEMTKEDEQLIERIQKPLVVYDCEMEDGACSSVCIDNEGAVKKALNFLYQSGASDIKYLCTGKNIYNFRKRREAFQNTLIGNNYMPKKDDLVELGEKIPEITEHMLLWLEKHPCPEGFLFENYQVSIGVLTALRRAGIRVPEQVKVIGIDEIPEYILPDIKLTQIKIPHAERAIMAMDLMDREIEHSWTTKVKVFAEPEVIVRESL